MAAVELSARPRTSLRGLLIGAIVTSLAAAVLAVLLHDLATNRGVRIKDEFEAKVVAVTADRDGLCIAAPNGEPIEDDCGSPIFVPDAPPLQVGDRVMVTRVWLDHGGISYLAFYVGPVS
ncbi:MAG: hypothetical protein ACRCYU_04865 [Nocardioides sp.]